MLLEGETMKTIAITFKGDLEVRRQDIVVYDANGIKVNTTELDVPTIVAGLKDGTYRLDFFETYPHSFGGAEEYEFTVAED
jgi:hypothetical protein